MIIISHLTYLEMIILHNYYFNSVNFSKTSFGSPSLLHGKSLLFEIQSDNKCPPFPTEIEMWLIIGEEVIPLMEIFFVPTN